jgi:hypothetical protein
MVPEEGDSPEELKMPISFYYSGCYYTNNKPRLHKRYQVRRGNTSWDVSIAGLRWKGEPRVDIAIEEPPRKFITPFKFSVTCLTHWQLMAINLPGTFGAIMETEKRKTMRTKMRAVLILAHGLNHYFSSNSIMD